MAFPVQKHPAVVSFKAHVEHCHIQLTLHQQALFNMARIFLTGATGYIGGDLLYVLQSTHPEYECSVLVRDSSKAAAVSKAYPNVRIVLGDLDSASLIEGEASRADVVVSEWSIQTMLNVSDHFQIPPAIAT